MLTVTVVATTTAGHPTNSTTPADAPAQKRYAYTANYTRSTPMARRSVCNVPGCPQLTEASRCTAHRQQAERIRGSRQARGYDSNHDRLRARWAPKVRRGTVNCWRCNELIQPDDLWDLGHLDDRSGYGGPEHAACNRSAGGHAAHTPGV